MILARLLFLTLWVAGFLLMARAATAEEDAARAVIDFSAPKGDIRPLHGVNLGPRCSRGTVDLSAYHRELGIPFTRLHDVVWFHAEAVDIHTIFRDFRDDPDAPENYDFAETDDYIQAIVNVGSGIVYRLGESIEHTPRKYRVHPPADAGKWAAVCIGIIRHYNEGWAGGFHHGIRYWEIWNEPDVRPNMWTGTEEQFLDLYEVAAKAIKARFPKLKVGGPAVGNVGELRGEGLEPAPFLSKFLDRCRDRGVPLDFLSWHRYTADPRDLPKRARAVRRLLDERGFKETESHLNEWNYLPGDDWTPMLAGGAPSKREKWYAEMCGPRGAAFAAAGLILLEDSPLDMANFYTGAIQAFGLFDSHGRPQKVYFALKAFRGLLETPRRAATPPAEQGKMALCAGLSADGTSAAILASNYDAKESRLVLTLEGLPWKGPGRYEVFLVDPEHDLELVEEGALQPAAPLEVRRMKAPAVALIKLRPADGKK